MTRAAVREAISAAQPSGAGRLTDYLWPLMDVGTLARATVVGTNHRAARGGHAVTPTISGLLTSTVTWQYYKGRACLSVAGAGDCHRSLPWVIPLQIERFTGPDRDLDGERVYRVLVEMAFDTDIGPISVGDTGLVLYCNPNSVNVTAESTSQVANPDSAGFGIAADAASLWTFRSKISVVAANDFTALNGFGVNDIREWNVFELRLFSATRTQDARVQRYVNDAFIGEHNITGVVVPQLLGNSFNYLPKICRTGAGAGTGTLHVAGVRIIGGTAMELGL
jgi:hypothetical protein